MLDIKLLGGLQIGLQGQPVTGFVSSKAPALLAYLVVTGRPHQRDTLAALFWGEMSDADAKNNLRQTLSNLRKLLEPYLLITREAVQFDTAVPHTLDVSQFETHLQNGRAQTNHRYHHLAQAAALYQGDFLAGFYVRDAPDFEEWALAQRVRYRELALHVLHSLAEHHLQRGEYGRAIDAATRLLALEPWREEAHRQLMLAQLRSGQRSAALAQYETCRRLLAAELGVEPSAETITLYERI
ncbi:MAG TPA: BTAD domain-containing putative transcriptional regulator, partial [Chloroflexota bacterium]|nr:BTAD domain-containing putative transcriptional regulator [Chloroflexota bacterium]